MVISKASVLVVDDEIRTLRMVQHMLELEGYCVTTATSGEAGRHPMAELLIRFQGRLIL